MAAATALEAPEAAAEATLEAPEAAADVALSAPEAADEAAELASEAADEATELADSVAELAAELADSETAVEDISAGALELAPPAVEFPERAAATLLSSRPPRVIKSCMASAWGIAQALVKRLMKVVFPIVPVVV